MATHAARTLFSPCSPRLRLRLLCQARGALATSNADLASTAPRPTLRAMSSRQGPNRAILIHNVPDRQTRTVSSAADARAGGRFTFNVAASYVAKGIPYDSTAHTYQFNPYNRVSQTGSAAANKGGNRTGRPGSGQDAFFVSRIGENAGSGGGVAVGVADGVGGWMESGVDPADFSHAFCDYMATAARTHDNNRIAQRHGEDGKGTALTARQLMQKGYEAVCHDPAIKAGGSTAIVGLFQPDGTLEVANLGDSGFIHLRLNAVHTSSEPQTHAFNTPFQLSVVPPSMLLRAAAFGGAQLMDQPRDAEVTRHSLKHGDVLVFASDGLWDNLFNQDILRIVSHSMLQTGAWSETDEGVHVVADLNPYTNPEVDAAETTEPRRKPTALVSLTLQSLVAMQIVSAAKAASVNAKLNGPFAKEVKKYYPNERWQGGKEDDICVVAVVVSEERPPPKAKL